MLEAKHPLVRNLDPFTKRTIILITQSSPHLKPSNYATLFRNVKKESFQKDLAFLADRLVNQTLRPLSSPPVSSLALAEIDPLPRNLSLHSTAIPSLPEIRKSVRDTIDECFRDKSHNPHFTEARILDALKQLPSDQQNQIKQLKEQLRDAQEEARLYRTMSSATSNTLLSSASSAPSETKSEHKEIKCFSCEEIGHFGEDCLCTSKHRNPRIEPRNSTARRPIARSQTFIRGSQRLSKRASMAISIDPAQHLEPLNTHLEIFDPNQPLYELSTTPLFQNQTQNQGQSEMDQHQSHSRHLSRESIQSRTRDNHRYSSNSRELVSSTQAQPSRESRISAWDGSRRPVPISALSAHIASIPVPVSSSTLIQRTPSQHSLLGRTNQFSIVQMSRGTMQSLMTFPMVQRIMAHPLELAGVCFSLFFIGKNLLKGVTGTFRILHGVTVLVLSNGKA
jgi:hypothetical protein